MVGWGSVDGPVPAVRSRTTQLTISTSALGLTRPRGQGAPERSSMTRSPGVSHTAGSESVPSDAHDGVRASPTIPTLSVARVDHVWSVWKVAGLLDLRDVIAIVIGLVVGASAGAALILYRRDRVRSAHRKRITPGILVAFVPVLLPGAAFSIVGIGGSIVGLRLLGGACGSPRFWVSLIGGGLVPAEPPESADSHYRIIGRLPKSASGSALLLPPIDGHRGRGVAAPYRRVTVVLPTPMRRARGYRECLKPQGSL